MHLNADGDGRDLWLSSGALLLAEDVDKGEDKDEDSSKASNGASDDRTDGGTAISTAPAA